ncbi:MAG: 30S ribosomal protein S1 [Kiritimatiellae bacterium]|nr:30S ribosomal protein S1 [Kiritimatiellia bacterium]MBP5227277.1 30S ribosomal protein S1 [Kiritimatiellia bacterium]
MAIHKPQKETPRTGAAYDFLRASIEAQTKIEVGTIIKGTISEIKGNEVLVNIGYKSDGIVPASEFEDISAVKVGDEIDVFVVALENDRGDVVQLSKSRADEKLRWDAVLAKYTEGGIVHGTISSKVRGGLIVKVDGVEAFLPGSQIDVTPIHDPDPFIGQDFDFKIIKISNERRNIIVSRRELIEEQMADKKRELLSTIEKGQHRIGRVKNITDFGAFVDLDGLDGLLHITDMSWGRIKHPSEMLKVGQELDVIILDVDMERERVSLGLKQATPNPWTDIESKYPVNSRLRGKVVNLVPYGAFVEIEPGIEGLVHVSEFSWTKRIARASDVLSVGDEVDVVVLSIDSENQKIALGIRQTEENPWDTVQDRYPVGSRVTGKVRNFTAYGAFVELEEGIDGMIHVSDMSWTRKINHPSEVLTKGQQVEAVVLEVIPADQRISLGLKQASDDPWNTITSRYAIGQLVKGKVSKIASFGAFVELEDGVDGLVHISQISDQHIEKVKDALKVGQEVEARIVKIDRDDRRIGLSIKAVAMNESQVEELSRDLSVTDLKPGENLVGLAAAFDDAFAQSEEWHPGAE